MPSVSATPAELSALTSLFPLTDPVPTPSTHPSLIPPSDVAIEEDLSRNPDNPRQWSSYIDHIKETNFEVRTIPDEGLSEALSNLLGPLASAKGRHGLQAIVSIYERALAVFPTSYKWWKAYLEARSAYVLGKAKRPSKQEKTHLELGPDLLDNVEERGWEGGLNGVVGWTEWRALVIAYERALMWLPRMPRIWLDYLSIFSHPRCPPPLSHTHARRTFDRALRSLPGSLHLRIWKEYLLWAEMRGGETCVRVWRRYLKVDPSLTERYVSILLAQPTPRALEAAKLLLSLARKAASGTYKSPDGKSPYQLLTEWLDLCERFPDAIGFDPEEAEAFRKEVAEKEGTEGDGKMQELTTGQVAQTGTNRGKGKHAAPAASYDADVDPVSTRKLDVEAVVKKEGLEVYHDQAGRLWTGLATYWIKMGELDKARDTFEAGINSVVTVRDFTQIFDAYSETSEQVISYLMEELANPDDEEDEDEEESLEEKEEDLDQRMKDFERLMDRRPFLVNDVLLRRNPHDVQEWEKRVALWGTNDEKIVETYTNAIATINPRKATANFHQLFINFARFYEEGGSEGDESAADLASARKIFEKATTIPFKKVDELAEVWCEWAEMEVRNSNYDEAIRVMQRATALPRNTKVSFYDDSLPVQARLFKSLKLWAFYVDLEESIGSVETTKKVYDKIMELKIANAQVIVNYAVFLEENNYFEEAFKVYERGVEVFTYPIAFELWNVYLSKFVKRYGGTKIERARDLFEQALDKCPPQFCKPLYLMYGRLEEEHGLAKRAMDIYDRATSAVSDADRFDMYTFYIAKVAANFGLAATRPIYERAIEVLPDRQTAEMCLRFAGLERKLGEIDRARAIYAHASQFCDPRTQPKFWEEWNAFEIETGSEDTFREMLRIKRSVQAQFNTEISYLASALAARQQPQEAATTANAGDAMAQAEAAAKANKPALAFVAATKAAGAPQAAEPVQAANPDEIGGDDEDLL